MSIPISSNQIDTLITEVNNGDFTGAYNFLSSYGYAYASWANGVAQGNTFAGTIALDFLRGTALVGIGSLACQSLSDQAIQSIRQDMAREYLLVLAAQAGDHGDIATTDINAPDVWEIHQTVFERHGLGIENWTLDAPFKIIEKLDGPETLETEWARLRDTGGDYADALLYNTVVVGFMYKQTYSSDPEIKALADTWMQNIAPALSAAVFQPSGAGSAWPGVLNLSDILTDLGGGVLDFFIPPAYGDEPLSQHPVIFGSKDANTLNGSDNAELLYGGAGNDTLTGNGGNDYLEGGQGNDTYLLQTTGGIDTILDHGGSDQIQIDGAAVSGAFSRPAFDDGKIYYSADKAYELRMMLGETWRVSARDAGTGEYRAVADIDGWLPGEFGITKGTASPVDRVSLSFQTSLAYMNMNGSAATQGVQFDGGSKSDSFSGSSHSDVINTGDGRSNYVLANGGDDKVQGGDSLDFIRTGANGTSTTVSDKRPSLRRRAVRRAAGRLRQRPVVGRRRRRRLAGRRGRQRRTGRLG
jgi:Ca2+-binding RTX toxin-like protein